MKHAELLRYPEAAEMAGVSRRTLESAVAKSEIAPVKSGRYVAFRPSEVQRWMLTATNRHSLRRPATTAPLKDPV